MASTALGVYAAVAFLGLVQGLTEFLPVSSTGHLSALRVFFLYRFRTIAAWGLFGDLTLHLGTMIAALIYFLPSIYRDLRIFFPGHSPTSSRAAARDFWLAVVVCTGVTGVFGLLVHDRVEQSLHSPYHIAVGFLVTASVLLLSRFLFRHVENRPWSVARIVGIGVFVGLAQTLALWPGVSRSGLTIVAALAVGLAPLEAFRFSFYTGLPLMAGAWVYDLVAQRSLDVGRFPVLAYVIGAVVAALSGWWALTWLQHWTVSGKLYRFGYYCLALAFLLAVLAGVL